MNSTLNRLLQIDFELYTDNDPEFKKELIILMIENLVELREALATDHSIHDLDNFKNVIHKIKPTLSMLNDEEFLETIELLKDTTLAEGHRKNTAIRFHEICNAIIKSLENEIS